MSGLAFSNTTPHQEAIAGLLALEEALDRCLQERLPDRGPTPDLLMAARHWSEAVWAIAEAVGPISLDVGDIARAVDLAARPVFVCGAHRSGTTLMRDLLDGHPSLTVLPSEGSFLTNTQAQLARLNRRRHVGYVGCEWLCRLANPINRPPYWLLGRTTDEASPYVSFARALMAWWSVVDRRLKPDVSLRPLVAVALAYGFCAADRGVRARRWVEKTPGNERFLDRLFAELPGAKVIHVIRQPLAVFASRKRLDERATGSFGNARNVLRHLALSYRTAIQRQNDDRFCLVRFEDLIARTPETMEKVARFLDVERLPILLRPTVAGRPASSNSAFAAGDTRGEILRSAPQLAMDLLTQAERQLVASWVGDLSGRLGYELPSVGVWRARILRLASRMS